MLPFLASGIVTRFGGSWLPAESSAETADQKSLMTGDNISGPNQTPSGPPIPSGMGAGPGQCLHRGVFVLAVPDSKRERQFSLTNTPDFFSLFNGNSPISLRVLALYPSSPFLTSAFKVVADLM